MESGRSEAAMMTEVATLRQQIQCTRPGSQADDPRIESDPGSSTGVTDRHVQIQQQTRNLAPVWRASTLHTRTVLPCNASVQRSDELLHALRRAKEAEEQQVAQAKYVFPNRNCCDGSPFVCGLNPALLRSIIQQERAALQQWQRKLEDR